MALSHVKVFQYYCNKIIPQCSQQSELNTPERIFKKDTLMCVCVCYIIYASHGCNMLQNQENTKAHS